jgi:hypothetical protein
MCCAENLLLAGKSLVCNVTQQMNYNIKLLLLLLLLHVIKQVRALLNKIICLLYYTNIREVYLLREACKIV